MIRSVSQNKYVATCWVTCWVTCCYHVLPVSSVPIISSAEIFHFATLAAWLRLLSRPQGAPAMTSIDKNSFTLSALGQQAQSGYHLQRTKGSLFCSCLFFEMSFVCVCCLKRVCVFFLPVCGACIVSSQATSHQSLLECLQKYI